MMATARTLALLQPLLRRGLGASLLVAGLAGTSPVHAQAGAVTLSGGYGRASLTWPTMTRFLDSYTKAVAPDLSLNPTLGGGTVKSALVDVEGFGCIGFQQLTTTPVARYKSGGERAFAVRQNLLVFAIEPSFQRRLFFVGGVLGFYAGTMHVASSYHYPDGTRSLGSDRPLNGDYGGITLGGFVGAKAGLTWKLLAVTARAEYFSKGLVKDDLSDKSSAKNTTANAFGGVGSPDFLPLDYGAYLAGPFGYSAVDQSVATDLRSLRVQVQVGLLLFPLDTD